MAHNLKLASGCALVYVATACVILRGSAVSVEAEQQAILDAKASSAPGSPGSFPDTWIHGADEDHDPRIQVHAYNDDTYILRQSKFDTFEAPFLYLIFGLERVLLMDTGSSRSSPVQATVEGIIREWLARNGKDTIDLIVQHTHGHFDHVQGDKQFRDAPFVVEIASARRDTYAESWGFADYPNDRPTLDLGGRVLDVLGTPGHYPASVTLYDRETQLLLTGDIVYPGHLFVFSQPDWFDFVDSIQRLVTFAGEHPVHAVVGCHIETNDVPFEHFAYGTPIQRNEHVLQLQPTVLTEVLEASLRMGDDPDYSVHADFVIHPVYKSSLIYNGE